MGDSRVAAFWHHVECVLPATTGLSDIQGSGRLKSCSNRKAARWPIRAPLPLKSLMPAS